MTVNCISRAAWLTVGVLVYLQTETTIGFPSVDSSLAEQHGSRLAELARISSRLEQQKLVRRKRLVSLGQKSSTAVGGDLPLGEAQLEPSDFQPALQRKRRDSAWTDMHEKYKLFHDEMSQFITDLLGKLKPGSPAALQHMAIIPDIIPKDDPDFMSQNADEVVERVFIALGFTERVLQGAKQYVKNDSIDWFESQAAYLRLWMSLVELTLANVRLSDTQTIAFYGAGIGDINMGFDTYKPVDVAGLKELLQYI